MNQSISKSNTIIQESIQEALLVLIKDRPLDEIHITDIITKAGVSRASFYNNFSSKMDILERQIQVCISDAQDIFSKSFENRFIYLMRYLSKNERSISTIINAHLEYKILEGLNKTFLDNNHVIESTLWIGFIYNIILLYNNDKEKFISEFTPLKIREAFIHLKSEL